MGHHSCCNKQKVKRGLWSPEEDEKLVNFISTNGHGCWSSVPNLSGLQRCGKSCRLRWINYLRPDLKRGDFSKDEVTLILDLHKIIGNKWAQIARYLPGRTDNEVKNFWNSVIKKKMFSNGECNERIIYSLEEENMEEKDQHVSSSLSSSSSKDSSKMKNILMKDYDSWIEQMIGLQFQVVNHEQNYDDGVNPYSILQSGSTARVMGELIDDGGGDGNIPIIIGDHVGVDDVELCSEVAWEPDFFLPSSTMFM